MMAKLLCIPILVLFISARSLQQQATENQDGFVPPRPVDEDPAKVPAKPQTPTIEASQIDLVIDFLAGLNFKPHCKEWETIQLTIDDIDLSNFQSIMQEQAVTIKTGNLKGHKIGIEDLYYFNKTTRKGRACACHVNGIPCIPLCCKSYQESSMKGGKLTCLNKTEDPDISDAFAKHLVFKEKMEEKKFVIVHHNGLNSLSYCANAALSYKPGSSKRISPEVGNLTNVDESVFDSGSYCFLSEKKGKDYKFAPVYCQKSAGFQTTPPPPLAIICYSIASIAVLFLANQ